MAAFSFNEASVSHLKYISWAKRNENDKSWDTVLEFDDGLKNLCSREHLRAMSDYFVKLFEWAINEYDKSHITLKETQGSVMERVTALHYYDEDYDEVGHWQNEMFP
jgi:hypothetical protein